MTTVDARSALGDLLHAALDDTGLRLGALAQRRLLGRMVELAAVAGLRIVRDT